MSAFLAPVIIRSKRKLVGFNQFAQMLGEPEILLLAGKAKSENISKTRMSAAQRQYGSRSSYSNKL
jgi:hypothetical protein